MNSTSLDQARAHSPSKEERPSGRFMPSGLDDALPASGLLRRYRRYFAIAAFLLLATPLVVGIVRPDSAASILKEGRRLTPIPRAPANRREWFAFPKEVDAYLQDHFGLRQAMIRTFEDTTRPLSFGNAIVLIGRGGRLFYLGDDAVLQSAELIYRRPQVVGTADLLARMNNWLTGRGIHFLVAVPPSRLAARFGGSSQRRTRLLPARYALDLSRRACGI